jgi:hypothetical protein
MTTNPVFKFANLFGNCLYLTNFDLGMFDLVFIFVFPFIYSKVFHIELEKLNELACHASVSKKKPAHGRLGCGSCVCVKTCIADLCWPFSLNRTEQLAFRWW